MLHQKDLKPGDVVYFFSDVAVVCGRVVIVKQALHDHQVCVELDHGLRILTPRQPVYATAKEAWFERARQCYKRAAEALAESGTAFGEAGLPEFPSPMPELYAHG